MSSEQYTPTLSDLREVWIEAQDMTFSLGMDDHGAEFDRGIAIHDAEVIRKVWSVLIANTNDAGLRLLQRVNAEEYIEAWARRVELGDPS